MGSDIDLNSITVFERLLYYDNLKYDLILKNVKLKGKTIIEKGVLGNLFTDIKPDWDWIEIDSPEKAERILNKLRTDFENADEYSNRNYVFESKPTTRSSEFTWNDKQELYTILQAFVFCCSMKGLFKFENNQYYKKIGSRVYFKNMLTKI